MNSKKVDLLILGGGLSGGLLAYRFHQVHPEKTFLLIEKENSLGGNHTWSFHKTDLAPTEWQWVQPFVHQTWTSHSLKFQKVKRNIPTPYASFTSTSFQQVLMKEFSRSIKLSSEVIRIDENSVLLSSSERIEFSCAIDARGENAEKMNECGYQKFMGLDITFESPHPISEPILMDAECEQKDGYRFFYLLPWSDSSLLIEDTRYSNSSDLDKNEFRNSIFAYLKDKKFPEIKSIDREETGCLPIPLTKNRLKKNAPPGRLPAIGMRGGFFHQTTGYSLPFAVKTADLISDLFSRIVQPTSSDLVLTLKPLHKKLSRQSAYFRFLNRMLFRAADPSSRFKIFERFYTLPQPLIERFYRAELTLFDRFRILAGKPPVPVLKALPCFTEGSIKV